MSLRRVAPTAAGLIAGRAAALRAGRSAALGAGRSAAIGAGCGSAARHGDTTVGSAGSRSICNAAALRAGRSAAIGAGCGSATRHTGSSLKAGRSTAIGCGSAPRHGYSFAGSAGARMISTGAPRRPFSSYLESSLVWIKDKGKEYEKFTEQFNQADQVVQTTFRIGQYMFSILGVLISGLFYVIDHKVDVRFAKVSTNLDKKINELSAKLDQKLDSLSKSHDEFKRIAVRDFQDHVSSTQLRLSSVQSDLNKLREKVLDVQEEEREHRQLVGEAAKFLKLKGYIVVSNEEFTYLLHKLKEIELKISTETSHQVSLDSADDSPLKRVASSSSAKVSLDSKDDSALKRVAISSSAKVSLDSKDDSALKKSVVTEEVVDGINGSHNSHNGVGTESEVSLRAKEYSSLNGEQGDCQVVAPKTQGKTES